MDNIIAFSNRAPSGTRLLTRDKIDLCLWETICDDPEISRVVIYESSTTGEVRGGDLVLIYGPQTPWARWGLAREDGRIVLWECGHGVDIGRFATMREALQALEQNAATVHDRDMQGRAKPPPVLPGMGEQPSVGP